MKARRSILFLSLVLNLALVVAAGFLLTKRGPGPTARQVTRKVTIEERAPATNAESPLTISVTNAPFRWSQIESTNFEVYVANLRAIHCPENTIRDIITAELEDLFLQKLAAIAEPVRQDFWRIFANLPESEKMIEEKFREIEEIGKDYEALLKKLLGTETPLRDRYVTVADRMRGRYSFVPDDKRDQLVALEVKLRDDRAKLNQDLRGQPELSKRLEALNADYERQRREVMSPEELGEFSLRTSRFAYLRDVESLPGYTPDEMRTLVKIQQDVWDARPLPKEKDPSYQKAQEEQKAEMDAKMKAFLGPERFAEYARGQDGTYREMYRFANRMELPDGTAEKVYDAWQFAQKQAKEVRQDNTLSEDEREALIDVLMDQTQKSLTDTLGTTAAGVYQKNGGQWVNRLADP